MREWLTSLLKWDLRRSASSTHQGKLVQDHLRRARRKTRDEHQRYALECLIHMNRVHPPVTDIELGNFWGEIRRTASKALNYHDRRALKMGEKR